MTRGLAVDVGGSNFRVGLCGSDRPDRVEPLARLAAPSDLDAFVRTISALAEQHQVACVGVAVPGLASGTTCRWVPNLPFLDNVDLAALWPGLGIALGNDAHFALLAEAQSGAARDLTDCILLAIGTGIGSAVLADGRILRGARGGAASFGWACADPADQGDDRDGWLERQASGRAFDRQARTIGLDNGEALVDRARASDHAALRAIADIAAKLGAALAGAVALLDPQRILVSGGLADALDLLGPPILGSLRKQLPPHLRSIDLSAGDFGPNASLVGAGIAAFKGSGWATVR